MTDSNSIQDNVTLSSNGNVTLQVGGVDGIPPDDGWKFISAAGASLNNASTNGSYVSRAYLNGMFVSAADSRGYIRAARSYSGVSPKIKMRGAFTEVKIKDARTTTFTATNKGATRLAALQELNSAKINYWPGSYYKAAHIRHIDNVPKTITSGTSWEVGSTDITNLGFTNSSIVEANPERHKILGVHAYSITSGANSAGAYTSFASFTDVCLDTVNATSTTITMDFYSGNKQRSESTTTTGSIVGSLHAYVHYISQYDLQIPSSSGFEILWQTADGESVAT